jgi:hypothetical protein
MRKVRHFIFTSSVSLLVFITSASAAPIVRRAVGANPAGIQATVDQFRSDLGPLNPNNGQSFTSGRREINWDGVPDDLAAPHSMPNDFFNAASPRGVMLNSIESGSAINEFMVSADSSNPFNAAPLFGNINPTYPGVFQTFSAQRLFVTRLGHQLEVTFFIPGTKIPATVSGFGLVFADVDRGGNAIVQFFAPDGSRVAADSPLVQNNGLSFIGMSFNDGTRIARVVIESGNSNLTSTNNDQNTVDGIDVVAMDDFIYGEPRATAHHPADYDGDGTADLSIYRPSTGQWFVLNSGSSTVNITKFGLDGDVPVDGDFDGDSRSDIGVYRPSSGTWFRLNSSDGLFSAENFGLAGDKPVASDYDKDGKSDIAVWRPSSGDYFVKRSSNGQAQITHWGLQGDIPILGAAQ